MINSNSVSFLNIQNDISLKSYNTFGLEVKAKFFVEVVESKSVKASIQWAKENNKKVIVLGGGSNVLFTNDIDALVVRNSLIGVELLEETDDSVLVKSAAGEVWHELVLFCIEKGLGGIENMSLIPGSVGAAPMQNIGAYGVEIKDVFHSLEALNVESLELESFSASQCQFGYRESVFKRELKDKYFITSVTLKLSKQPKVNTSYGAIQEVLQSKGIIEPSIRDVSNAVIQIRQSKLPDPAKIGNSGSFFKNPVIDKSKFENLKSKFESIPSYPQLDGTVKVPAGWLIEQCGWKGKRFGDVGVHKNQALVLVNYGKGKGRDIQKLAEDIQASVKAQFGVTLDMEVNVI